MKKVGLNTLLSFLVFCACTASAQWSAPQLLFELNNVDAGIGAYNPFISPDSNRIYYIQADAAGAPWTPIWKTTKIYEASRNQPDEPFVLQRVATELYGGDHMGDPWVSADGLRLYYVQIEYRYGRWHRFLKMAIRDDIGERWRPYKAYENLSRFSSMNVCSQISLTSDEKVILWMGYDTTSGLFKIFTASRPSVFHDFSNITELVELTEFEARDPYLSPDGLTVYFAARGENNHNSLWMARRSCLEDAFDHFEPLDAINQYGRVTFDPCVSADGLALYFVQYQSSDINFGYNAGIFVSYWLDEPESPYTATVKMLQEAMSEKTQALTLLDSANEKEQQAYMALLRLPPSAFPTDFRPRDRVQARILVLQSIAKQKISRHHLAKAIVDLGRALKLFVPAEPEPLQLQSDLPPQNAVPSERERPAVIEPRQVVPARSAAIER